MRSVDPTPMIMMHTLTSLLAGTVAGTVLATPTQSLSQSPTSSATPYVQPVPGGPAMHVRSILTVGDSVNMGPTGAPYALAGRPDGLGASDNGDGTMTLLVNHEFSASTMTGVRGHQAGTGASGGAYISRWIVATTPGPDFLRVLNGTDFMNSAVNVTAGAGSLNVYSRFCSADLGGPTAFYNSSTGLGTQQPIYLTGEESGSNGRVVATGIVDRVAYQLPAFDPLQSSWENAVARPLESDTTLVAALSDGSSNRVFMHVGAKQATGNAVQRAGLLNGIGYGVRVVVNGVNLSAESRDFCFGSSAPVYSARFALVLGNSGTSFLRPEDGAWDPSNPRDFYFATTDRLDQVADGVGTQVGRSRLFRMRFDNAADPLAGGQIEALLVGTEGQNMLDNVAAFNDLTGGLRIMMQEDTGDSSHNAKTWLYTEATDSLTLVLQGDPARFGNIGVPATLPFTRDEEHSGVIDARDSLGLGWFVGNTQAHYDLPSPLFQGGQLYAFYVPAAIGSCVADVAQPPNGVVDGEDLGAMLGSWGQPGRADLNADGTTDGADLGVLLGAWGPCGE